MNKTVDCCRDWTALVFDDLHIACSPPLPGALGVDGRGAFCMELDWNGNREGTCCGNTASQLYIILIHLLTNLYVVIGWVGAGGALVS